MSGKKETAKNILEIGVGAGGSIKLWKDYFKTATIWGFDKVDDIDPVHHSLYDDERVRLVLTIDAYDIKFINKLPKVNFDFIIDEILIVSFLAIN
jgi:hypothetical protein